MKLSVENGCFSYSHAKRQVLRDISFQADSGDVIAVLGPNGAGKTTLLRCIMGFLPWKSGKSALDGRDIRTIPYRELWSSVSYVPQARGTVVAYSALETVLLGRGSRVGAFSKPSKSDITAAKNAMERLHIGYLAEKQCSEMSGGELQMVLIARALAAEPKVLILDEPESNLDFKNQLLVLDAMSGLAAGGMTCIFNTHYPSHALQRAGRALLLSKDGGCLFGDASDVVTEANIQSVFEVRAVIGQVETPINIISDVIPLEVLPSSGELLKAEGNNEHTLAVIAVISNNFDIAQSINGILHAYSQYLVGRMGMPYKKLGVYIINITIDAPQGVIEALSSKLRILPGVSVKTTYARS